MQIQCKLIVVLVIASIFMVVEVVGGFIAHRYSPAALNQPCATLWPEDTSAQPAQMHRYLQRGCADADVLDLPCSVAIMTDAAHLLSDTSGFGVALFASIYATKKSMSTHTFG